MNENVGIECRRGRRSKGRTYQSIIDGKWYDINRPLDYNQDGKIESSVTFDLNGDTLTQLTGGPNEFARMRFDGLDSIPTESSRADLKRFYYEDQGQQAPITSIIPRASTSSSLPLSSSIRQLLHLDAHSNEDESELSFDAYEAILEPTNHSSRE